MQSKVKKISFKGYNIYSGIDVHEKSWKVTIMVGDKYYKTLTMVPKAENLEKYLAREFPGGSYYTAYEAGFCGFSIHRKLEEKGIRNMVVNPADIPTTDKDRSQKEDRRDSRKIARSLKNGDLTAIYVPERELEELRSLVRYRKSVSRDLAREKNRIKSFLKVYGIEEPEEISKIRSWSSKYVKWLEGIEMDTEYGKMVIEERIETIKFLREKKLKVQRELQKVSLESKYREDLELLRSVTGIGRIISITLLTEIVDINRFKTLDQLCSYVGLIPRTNSSGEKERHGRITRRSNKEIRSVLIESSWVAIRQDPALMLKYNELIKRMKGSEAIVRIAKKLLNRIRYVLKNRKKYERSIV